MDVLVSEIFKARPERWGLRGEPYLWDDMEVYFAGYVIPFSEDRFIEEFEAMFKKLTGISLDSPDYVHIDEYSHGGMSSGMIDSSYWKLELLPLLLERLRKINSYIDSDA